MARGSSAGTLAAGKLGMGVAHCLRPGRSCRAVRRSPSWSLRPACHRRNSGPEGSRGKGFAACAVAAQPLGCAGPPPPARSAAMLTRSATSVRTLVLVAGLALAPSVLAAAADAPATPLSWPLNGQQGVRALQWNGPAASADDAALAAPGAVADDLRL